MISMGVLQPQLIPVAQGKRDEWRIGGGFVAVILCALQPVEQETRAPLPAPFVVHIRIQTE